MCAQAVSYTYSLSLLLSCHCSIICVYVRMSLMNAEGDVIIELEIIHLSKFESPLSVMHAIK